MNKIEKQYNQLFTTIQTFNDYIEYGFKKQINLPNFKIKKNTENYNKNIHNNNKITKLNHTVNNKNKKIELISLAEKIIKCNDCNLYIDAGKVPGQGNSDAQIFIINYPPSFEEEIAGRPLIGEPGEYFKKWMDAIKLKYSDLFITNIVKCPPKKNKISKTHIETCSKYIDTQLNIIRPKLILTLGQLTISSIKKEYINLKENHGKLLKYNNIPLIPTYHPLDVLKNMSLKKLVWDDLKKLKKLLSN